MMRVRHIFISPGHNFFGRYSGPAGTHPTHDVAEVECVAGYGLRGDRFFGYRPDYKGQVTFFAMEVCEALRREFKLPGLSPEVFRRNVISEGVDLNTLIGTRFTLQGIELEAVEECRPCHWMDKAVAPGAEDWMKGRGGLRCRLLTSGWLRRDAP
ncbi:MAG: molybdenum cofactor biosysynthesis protein [Candidatus Didemnitutus sp.]|nr:molybdenum cofactor biosysynthesis protein [Candidatus Didemnitutus sp.]